MSRKRQCELLNVPRSSTYYKKQEIQNNDTEIVNESLEIYQKWPFYGYRRIHIELRKRGFIVNHKRVQRLLKHVGLKAIYPAKNTSLRNQKHKVFDYLLKDLEIKHPDHVWQVDITYIKLKVGFVYLICLIDVFSRKIMGWNLSIFLDTESCLKALENALLNGNPEIINSDQGCQFTSEAWVNFLQDYAIKISMDGKGRCLDNIYIERLWRSLKYELVYLHSFDSVEQAKQAIKNYINFYNHQRPHQSLNYHTPNNIYQLKYVPSKKDLLNNFLLNKTLTNREIAMVS